jgi:hypothetical protein
MRTAWIAGIETPAVVSTETIDTASASNASLVWASGNVDVITWIDSSRRWTVDLAAVAATCGTVTVCEGVVYVCGHGDPRCTANNPLRSYTCSGATTATCVGANGTAFTHQEMADNSIVFGNNGTTVWVFERPAKTGGMTMCWILLLILNALRVGAFATRNGRVDAACVVTFALVMRATVTSGAAAPPHIWSESGTDAADIVIAIGAATVAAAAVIAAAWSSVDAVEPFRVTTEHAALAAVATSFPQSVAGPEPATVIAAMTGLAICAVGGRSKSIAAAPGIVWATACMIYPAIADAVVTSTTTATAALSIVIAVTTTTVAVAIAQ